MKKNSAEIRFTTPRTSKTLSSSISGNEPKSNGPSPNIQKKDSSNSFILEDDGTDNEEFIPPGVMTITNTSLVFEGVRFTPKYIEFSDAFEGKQFAQTIKIQNVGKNPVVVRIGEPKSFIFQINKHDNSAKLLAPGSTLNRKVTYTYHNDDLVQRSVIPVQINNRTLDYAINVNKAMPVIEIVPPELDFKSVNMGASAKTLKMTIMNTGGQGTKFTVDLGRNELDLVVRPMRGTIRAKNQITVYVEMVGVREGEYFKELWITTSEQSIRVPVMAEVLRPRLEVYHPNKTGDFTLIDFPPTFIGTQRLELLVLRNFSAEMTPFVALAEINGEVKNMKEAGKIQEAFKMFSLSAEEGRFEPFESKIVMIMFKPIEPQIQKGWQHKEILERQTSGYEYLIFLRIIRVHCIERRELEKVESEMNQQGLLTPKRGDKRQSVMASVASTATFISDFRTNLPSDNLEQEDFPHSLSELLLEDDLLDQSDVIRLCIHGEAVRPNVLLQPSEIEFSKLKVGESETRIIKITNLSPISINFKFHKAVNVRTEPWEAWLKRNKAVEVVVTWNPKSAGKRTINLILDIFGKSVALYDEEPTSVCVQTINIPIKIDAEVMPKDCAPKIGLGITPLITNEVGILSEKVTFGSPYPKPQAAMLQIQKENLKPTWRKNQDTDNAIIAFPNDQTHLHYSWSKDKVCRTIFTGHFRYSPPQDIYYTFTEEELEKRREEYNEWTEFLNQLGNLRKLKKGKDIKISCEYDTSCPKSYNMLDFKFPKKFVSQTEKSKALSKYLHRDINLSEGFLMPLSPLFLCNIKVEPKLIDLSMVAPNSSVKKTLKMHNMNPFPICIRFIPGKSGVTLPGGDIKIIPASGRKSLEIVFQTKDLGRYNGFLDYVINGSHQFKITISANVMPKTLIFNESNWGVEFGDYEATDAFQPRCLCVSLINRLQSPIKYRWDVPYDSSFEIEPMSGEVPPLSNLQNEIYFSLDAEKSFPTEAYLISESGVSQDVKLTVAKRKPRVFFLSNTINLDNIPLNLLQSTDAIVRNTDYYDVVFEVLDWTPIPGVMISPRSGIIKARGFTQLHISIQIPALMSFSFDVTLQLQHNYVIVLKVHGQVIYPLIRLTPTDVAMRRISAQSFDIVPMCVENYGTTMAHISIDFKEFPEYTLGRKKPHLKYSTQDSFMLGPGKCTKIFIRFEPSDVARHQFSLPIIINGILGPSFLQNNESEWPTYYLSQYEEIYNSFGTVVKSKTLKSKIPCAVINCSVVGYALKISTLQINFQPKKKSALQFQSEEIKISNANPYQTTFCIRTDDLSQENSPFSLIVVDGGVIEYRSKSIKFDLEPYESVILRAEFTPCKPGIFDIDVPIFLKGYNDGTVYNYIHLSGEMKKPTLVVDANEVHFPPIPLEVGSEATLHVTAENYPSQDVIYAQVWEIVHEKKALSETLHFKWLDEPYIDGESDSQHFSIRIWFQSSVPVGLRTFIIFSDSAGEYVPVLVTASADNSAMTTHSFLSSRSTKYKYFREMMTEQDNTENFQQSYSIVKRVSSTKKIARFPADFKDGKGKGRNTRENNKRDSQSEYTVGSRIISAAMEPAPKLKVLPTKSTTRITQLNYVSLFRFPGSVKRDFIARSEFSTPSTTSQVETLSSNTLNSGNHSRNIEYISNDITYPYFPSVEYESKYGKNMNDTLIYVERWIYETVFHCDQYFQIPESCQNVFYEDQNKELHMKSIMDLLVNLAGENVIKFFQEKPPKDTPVAKMEYNYLTCYYIIRFLYVQGAVLPHVCPEHLLTYEDYLLYTEVFPTQERLSHGYNLNLDNPFRRGSESLTSLFSIKSSPLEEVASRRGKSSYSLLEVWSKPLLDDYEFERVSKKESVMLHPSKRKSYINDNEEDNSYMPEKKISFKGEDRRPSARLDKEHYFTQHKLDKTSFSARSTQAWLDVIIQMYRTLVLRKVSPRKTIPVMSIIELRSGTLSLDISDSLSLKKIGKKRSVSLLSFDSYESNVYTTQERILLSWLNHHYELQRTALWPYGNDCECRFRTFARSVDNFTTHLSDAVVLTAVTASHCPYLVPNYLLDVFPSPDSYEQIYHNAIKLTHAWREVNLGLTVEPRDIVNPNLVFMLMLVVHLYENLPTLSPRALIRFSAPLTKQMSRTVQLINNSPEKVCYQIKFIGDANSFFKIEGSLKIYIKPHKTHDLKIFYHAKKIQKATDLGASKAHTVQSKAFLILEACKNISYHFPAFLLLCGATESPKFAKHITFQLEGEPSELIESSSFKLTAPLYQMICADIPIAPPYKESAEYEIWYAITQPRVKGSLGLNAATKKWEEIWNRKVSRRLFLNQFSLAYQEGTKYAMLNVSIVCLSLEERFFWLLFRHSTLGDFIVKVQISPKLVDVTNGEFLFYIPETWNRNSACTCVDIQRNLGIGVDSSRCHLLSSIEIPARNDALWEANLAMFQKTLEADEKMFWMKHFEKKIGLRLVSWLLSQDDHSPADEEFISSLSVSVTYQLRLDYPASSHVKIPSKLKIRDVRSRSPVTLPIHISNKVQLPIKMLLTMTADNHFEVRTIRIILQKRPESSELISIPLDNLPEIKHSESHNPPETKETTEAVEQDDHSDDSDASEQ